MELLIGVAVGSVLGYGERVHASIEDIQTCRWGLSATYFRN
jgi:hypothetical protein